MKMNKTLAIAIILMFIGSSMIPILSAATTNKKLNQIIEDKTIQTNVLKTDEENLRREFFDIFSKVNNNNNNINNLDELLDLLLDKTDFPILSNLLSKLLRMVRLKDRELILSMGWSYNMNPFKTADMKMVKPFTIWMFMNAKEYMDIPSITLILQEDPFKVKTVYGNQLGFMTGFKGIYRYVPRDFPSQSFTYMMGIANNIMVMDLMEMS